MIGSKKIRVIKTLLKELNIPSSSHEMFHNLVMPQDYLLYLDSAEGDGAGYLSFLIFEFWEYEYLRNVESVSTTEFFCSLELVSVLTFKS